ncbi:TRAP transporter large permease [Lysinibacillus sp. OL1_EC]|uniref:TRAP transporter large permease n=1 Tax=Lysinibacillus TaxID=400634 RepID=UPI0006CA1330|nr:MULTISPECIES: TRAP transporter large permease [Lysinibacillus]MCM0625162.1 TRAP transporter large permease [Lysinibacillus sp. OL1_EC]MED3797399.1 TRAP transporter large permease [Lysinibacillus capsici]MED4554089.1 TRAP transporter large permease [Lysinibacillus capsici]TBV87375.1 TRAP transporter large permease [Lysinibacillus sp. OL1]UKJ44693.1 TRAP transporter large permease [Lysinibacillus sp. ACHW1.5]
MIALLLFGSFILLVFLRVPIAASLAVASMVVLFTSQGLSGFEALTDIMYTSVAKFTLLAIPFFILAGVIMDHIGISKRLIDFAQTLVGHRKGGIVLVTVLVAIFFAAISGSGPATVAAIGGILIPAMVKNGYRKETAGGLVASAGAIGIIIPPSIAFIIFAVVAGDQIPITINRLFMAGVIPGILVGIGLFIAGMYVRKRDIQKGIFNDSVEATKQKSTGKERWDAFIKALPGLMIPVIILGGIYGGFFTPTEAAVIAVVYGLIVGLFIHRKGYIKMMYRIFIESALQTAVVMIIVSAASVFAYIVTTEQIASTISNTVLGLTDNKIIILLLVNIILLIAGAFIDAISAFYIFVPILLPIMLMLDVDPAVFGVFMTINLAIGLFTPPVGLNLYVAASMSKANIIQISKGVVPFIVASVIVLLLVTYIPSLSTFLPDLLNIK